MADTVKVPSNINRDYLISVDVKDSRVNAPDLMFYITDKKTSNIFVQLIINMSTNDLIKKFVTLENASDYKLALNIIKPDNNVKIVEGQLLDETGAIFLFDLEEECKDLTGTYKCELYITCIVDDREEASTTNSFKYTVKPSILNNLDASIEIDKNYPILLDLIEQIKSLTGDIDTSQFATKKYVEDAIANLDLNDIDVDLSNYTTTEKLLSLLEEKASAYHTHTAADITEDKDHKFVTQKEKDLWNYSSNNPPDLSKYATTESLNAALENKANKEHVHNQYLTSHQDISGKVDKVEGKGLSTVDFTTEYETKLNCLSNYDDSNIKTLINNNISDIANINNSLASYVTVETLNNYVTNESFNTALGNVESLLGEI